MNIINKIENFLNESKIPPGLLVWVEDYKVARKAGNIKLAKELKISIDKEVKKLKLNPKDVY